MAIVSVTSYSWNSNLNSFLTFVAHYKYFTAFFSNKNIWILDEQKKYYPSIKTFGPFVAIKGS